MGVLFFWAHSGKKMEGALALPITFLQNLDSLVSVSGPLGD
jgi:hypothetical protein